MTSDILANAPPVLAGGSVESPPTGPFPEIPEEKENGSFSSPANSHDACVFLCTFPAHGEFVEEIGHEVPAASSCYDCSEMTNNKRLLSDCLTLITNVVC